MIYERQKPTVGAQRKFGAGLLLSYVFLALFLGTALHGRAAAGYSPIAYVLEDKNKNFKPDHIDEFVRLKGTITFIREVTPANFQIFMQDDSGGVMVYCQERPTPAAEGDLIEVEGRIAQYKGAVEIINPQMHRLDRAPALAPKMISAGDLNSKKFYGQLVQIKGKIVSARSRPREDVLLIDDGQNIAMVYINKSQKKAINISAFKEKSIVSVTGVAFQYAPEAPYNYGYELIPRQQKDLAILKEPPLFEVRQLILILAGIAFISLAALMWIYTLQKKVREKTEKLESIQQQLIQAEKLSSIGQIVSGVAHELNNPLCIVSGYSQLLQARVKDEKIRKDLERIVEAADRAAKIVQNLLTFARKRKLEKIHVNLNQLIEKTLELKAYQLKVDSIEVVRDLDPNLLDTQADPYQLQQVFLNIINNAHDALSDFRKKGTLMVRSEMVKDQIRISFRDDGPGICKTHLKKIFDPFFTTKEVGKGTGLGLSLSYGIVKEHGGDIYVQSEKGHGATFVVELPVSGRQAERSGETDKCLDIDADIDAKKQRILVVDDEQSVTSLISAALTHKGYKVDTCNEGKAALMLIKQGQHYYLIITDLKMPGMNGKDFYKHIKAINPQLAKRLVFITGDSANPETQAFLSEAGNNYIPKPFKVTDFMVVIEEAMHAVDAVAQLTT